MWLLFQCAIMIAVGWTGRRCCEKRLPDNERLAHEKCGRKGQYRKQTLIERYGRDIRLPDLREQIAQWSRHGHARRLRGSLRRSGAASLNAKSKIRRRLPPCGHWMGRSDGAYLTRNGLGDCGSAATNDL
jgi:hypothetical protein